MIFGLTLVCGVDPKTGLKLGGNQKYIIINQ